MFGVSTLSLVELGVLGPLQVLDGGVPVAIAGAKPRALLTMLGLHDGSVLVGTAPHRPVLFRENGLRFEADLQERR